MLWGPAPTSVEPMVICMDRSVAAEPSSQGVRTRVRLVHFCSSMTMDSSYDVEAGAADPLM